MLKSNDSHVPYAIDQNIDKRSLNYKNQSIQKVLFGDKHLKLPYIITFLYSAYVNYL